MAGSYPDVPSRRMAWDDDGTVAVGYAATRSATIQQSDGVALPVAYSDLAVADKQKLNEEDPTSTVESGSSVSGQIAVVTYALIFPELREIDGYYSNGERSGNINQQWIYTSGDTTNGRDGSWSALGSQVFSSATDLEDYRDSIQSAAVANRRSIAFMTAGGGVGGRARMRRFHLFGEISAGETPDRLLWVDNSTGSEFGLPIDYGDVPRGSAEDTEVLLRNNSGTLTASSVQVSAEALHLDSGAWYTFKEAGGSFQSTLPLSSSIGAGSDSPVLTIRRIIPDDETLGLHAGRAFATVGSWS